MIKVRMVRKIRKVRKVIDVDLSILTVNSGHS